MIDLPYTKKMILVVLDGWGHSEEVEYNAIRQARTPHFDSLMENYPNRLIEASGEFVGLPDGQMGNSEVGHLTLGAGRTIYQPLVRINKAVESGSINNNEEILKGMERVKARNKTLHIMGLTSHGGVHSHISHLFGILGIALALDIVRVRVHVITDGRDVPPDSALTDIQELQEWIHRNDRKGRIKIATLMGRFYAMDRDRRWDRTQMAYRYYVVPQESRFRDPVQAVKDSYDRGETDEFISPVQFIDDDGHPLGLVEHDDTLVFYNFRPDRARQIMKAFIYPYFDGFVRDRVVKPYFVAMTDYDDAVYTHIAFTEEKLTNTIGEVVSSRGLRQLRIAETEKYAHVTFFFSGGREDPFTGENRILVPSPKVKTYDQRPEMSALEITHRMEEELEEGSFELGVLNYANTDMVGHTGVMEAAVKAVETVDKCLGKLVPRALRNDYQLLITADHGNAEHMWNYEKNIPFTAHTTNPVYLIYVGNRITRDMKLRAGIGTIADIGPTILKQMGLPVHPSMSGTPFT
ncbi:MAG: 2,3-bisphosphoglycerate-independent phosphoglycerate mutase [Candidatus Thermoplasmatota archaeon]|nr:2,3-bisphosphoglycerate-independent phosphoglycerate mutase [Candidatus Thermoplasmatota archaeon]